MHNPTQRSPSTADPATYNDASGPVIFYNELAVTLETLLTGETDPIANAANAAAAIFHSVPELNWAGVYFLRGDELVLGPFQGRPACVRIPLGRGVCGTAAAERRSILVPDVRLFPGHIACDTASRSELVTPLLADGHVLGVLDLDSPRPARFSAIDQAGCERLASILARHLA
jgi:L-methionine (R)-S-oxide reductase